MGQATHADAEDNHATILDAHTSGAAGGPDTGSCHGPEADKGNKEEDTSGLRPQSRDL
jgi:hypothetical protein